MSKKAVTKQAPDRFDETKQIFERWECRRIENQVKGKKVIKWEKLKRLKEAVKITYNQAHMLNSMVITHEHNQFVETYFLPGEDECFLFPEETIV